MIKSVRLTLEEDALLDFVAGLSGYSSTSEFIRMAIKTWIAEHWDELTEKAYRLNKLLGRFKKARPSEAEIEKMRQLYPNIDPIWAVRSQDFANTAARELNVSYNFALGLITQVEEMDKRNLVFLKSFSEEYEKQRRREVLGYEMKKARMKYFGEGDKE